MSRDSEVRRVAAELEALYARLRVAVEALNAVVLPPPPAGASKEQVVT
jgi:hypothetical protein